MSDTIYPPDLTGRPFALGLTVRFPVPPDRLYDAWTRHIDRWLASPGSARMSFEKGAPFYFDLMETSGEAPAPAGRPHYGRILGLERDRALDLAWMSGAGGTDGAETLLSVRFEKAGDRETDLRLTHQGFATEDARNLQERTWRFLLDSLAAIVPGAKPVSATDIEEDSPLPAEPVSAPVAFDDLVEAFVFVSSGQPMEYKAAIAVETGAIHYHDEWEDVDIEGSEEGAGDFDMDFGDRYIPVPHRSDLDLGARLALRFTSEVLPDRYEQVSRIFHHRGAFGQFKSLLHEEGLLERWFAFEAAAEARALRDWCRDNGIPVTDRPATKAG